ncbi:MAG: hypothetical protein WBC96_12510, partial [Thermodesulfobacteriota bacterium]
MVNKNIITTFVAVFLIVGFLFLAMPKYANAGAGMPPGNPGCCQRLFEGSFGCNNSDTGQCIIQVGSDFFGFFPGESCNQQTGFCSGFEPSAIRDVPTLSEWGLLA